MSGARGDDGLLKALGERARTRAAAASATHEAAVPADSVAVDRIAAAVLAQRAEASGTRAEAPIIALPRRRARFATWASWKWAAVAAPLAAAAALALVVRRAPTADAPGASYDVSVSGHVRDVRGDHGGTTSRLEAREGSTQEVVLRPSRAVSGPLAARMLVVKAGVATLADVPITISERGVVKLEVTGAAVVGASEVRVVVAPPAALEQGIASARGAQATASDLRLPDVSLVRIAVDRANASPAAIE